MAGVGVEDQGDGVEVVFEFGEGLAAAEQRLGGAEGLGGARGVDRELAGGGVGVVAPADHAVGRVAGHAGDQQLLEDDRAEGRVERAVLGEGGEGRELADIDGVDVAVLADPAGVAERLQRGRAEALDQLLGGRRGLGVGAAHEAGPG